MAKSKPFGEILKELKDRKKFESEREKKSSEEKCKICKHNIMAIGNSNIPGVCKICTHLSIL